MATKAAKKTTAPVKAAEVKEEAVKAVETAAAPAEEKKAVAEKKAPAKKAAAKKPAAKKTAAKKEEVCCTKKVVIEYQGNDICTCSLVAKAKEISGIENPANVEIYIQPENNKVYYVVDDAKGDFDLF